MVVLVECDIPICHMANLGSIDEFKLVAALLQDVSNKTNGKVYNLVHVERDVSVLSDAQCSMGMSFLTETLPKLGKMLDKALSLADAVDATLLGLKTQEGSRLPIFIGELFNHICDSSGLALTNPSVENVRYVRQICYLFYKYELPYKNEQVQLVLERFERTEQELIALHSFWEHITNAVNDYPSPRLRSGDENPQKEEEAIGIARDAKGLLKGLFAGFDPFDIVPRHGPGAVATKQKPWEKWHWTNVSDKITSVYPLDAYFYANLGHVCDRLQEMLSLGSNNLPARVILVPKDSRGPRLISCEPVDFQWIQQGLGRRIVELVENTPLTKWNVFFTDQAPNQRGAELGSLTGGYATLDLNEASDRVSLDLVRLLFPAPIVECLEACRSSSTALPSGRILELRKYAPMGSCLCFPVLALTVWSILTAGATDWYTRERILVYGDDVIVPTAYAERAMNILESFGLKVNRDKSCTKGFFRESCGRDAFRGHIVTPVRLRTVWSSTRSPDVYTSWIAYANSFYDRGYFNVYDHIVARLHHVYGAIPDDSMGYSPEISLREVEDRLKPQRRRRNIHLQKMEYKIWIVRPKPIRRLKDGWEGLFRFLIETASRPPKMGLDISEANIRVLDTFVPFSVSSYTQRRTSELVQRWR